MLVQVNKTAKTNIWVNIMSKGSYELEESYQRVIKKFDEIDINLNKTEKLIWGLYIFIPLMAVIGVLL